MKLARLTVTILVLAGLLAVPAAAMADEDAALIEQLSECAALNDSALRLGCFDALARSVGATLPQAPETNVEAQPAGAQDLEERYSGRAPLALLPLPDADEREAFTRPVASISQNARGRVVVTLADGLVFEQTDSDRIRRSMLRAETVTLRPASFGSWFMSFDEGSTKIRVAQRQ
jgi:hypothetical protein